jgi:hypothetical protein
VVRKIRGGKTGYSIPFIIREGRGIVFLVPEAPAKTAAEQLSTGTCLDEAVGGVYKGLFHVIVGPEGAGKTWLMFKTASALKERGKNVVYIAVAGAGAIYAERFGVDTVEVDLNVEELFSAVISTDCDVVFIRGLEALSTLYGPSVLYTVLRILLQMARGGRTVVVSLRDLHDLDMLFDVIVQMEERSVIGVRGPQGRIGEKIKC